MKKKALYIFAGVLLLAVAFYAYREYNRSHVDLKQRDPDHSLSSASLIAAFEKDTASANKNYINSVVSVTGNIKSIDSNGNPVVISLGEPGEMSSVICSMDSVHAKDYKDLREGDKVTIKGICTGGETQDLFGTDVKLSRCVMEQ
jgi:hypothetical protein